MASKYKILFIDDDENILEVFESYVNHDDFDVETFNCAEKALEYIALHHQNIALVVSDFNMPGMNGFEFREKILETEQDIPFAVVTGFFNKKMAVEAMKLKICKFLEKPISEEEITVLIETQASLRIESLNEDREMVTEFLTETKPMLDEIEELILSLEEDPHDLQAVNTYFRLLHTIKGTSSCLGLSEIAGYSHKYEDLITRVKGNQVCVNNTVINVLLKGLDELRNLYKISANFSPFPSDLEDRAKIFDSDFSLEVEKNQEISSEDQQAQQDQASARAKKSKESKEDKISVSENLLGEFLEMSGELTVIRNSIFKSLSRVQQKVSGDKDVDHLHEQMVEMQKVSAILQNQIAEMKKVSIETVYRPMRRVVRDSCSVLGKTIDFSVGGETFKIDTSVAKLLNGALVHLLRNGVDHGIEEESVRTAAGKSGVGSLKLNAYETGEDIVIEIIDDGKGLDKEVLIAKAIEKGLFTKDELSKMSDQKIYSIIFESGFSTNTEVTSVSGRGVGMDMVRSSIEEFGGKILIDSTLGEGSKFVLIIPIPRSILIIKSLLVSSNQQRFNIPLDDVDEVVLYDRSKKVPAITEAVGSYFLEHYEDLCPLISLGETLGLSNESIIGDLQNIVIVKGEGYRYGILVDAIADIEEIVVKKLSPHFEIGQYLGTTFADNNAMSMILDCKGIAEKHAINNVEEQEDDRFKASENDSSATIEYMRFSTSKMENCAIELDHVHRLEEFKASEIQFSCDRAIIRYRGQSLSLISVEERLGISKDNISRLSNDPTATFKVLVLEHKDKMLGAIIDELNDIAYCSDEIEQMFGNDSGIKGTLTIQEKIVSIVDINHLINGEKGHLVFNNMAEDEQIVQEMEVEKVDNNKAA